MENHEMVIDSAEKYESHDRINKVLYKWIEHMFGQGGIIATMPAQSGRQENQILMKLSELERVHGAESKVKLMTFDYSLKANETGVTPDDNWLGHYNGDVYAALCENIDEPCHIAAWFDMTGGLSNNNINGINRCAEKMKHGSIFFLTIQILNPRMLTIEHDMRNCTDHAANTVRGNLMHAERLLMNSIKLLGNKYILKLRKEEYETQVYKRTRSVFAVLGFVVGEYK
jgi:hypothetical protein